jgi:hypothetical protein
LQGPKPVCGAGLQRTEDMRVHIRHFVTYYNQRRQGGDDIVFVAFKALGALHPLMLVKSRTRLALRPTNRGPQAIAYFAHTLVRP